METKSLLISPMTRIGDIAAGDDLRRIIGDALERPLVFRDILVIAQKIVSKSEGRLVALADVKPSARALELAVITRKDARLVELILSETAEVMRAVPDILVVRHKLGFVLANAGIDCSNLGCEAEAALLLPVNPDASAMALRTGLTDRFGVAPAIVISDSFGRAWRIGTVNTAIGVAGLPSVIDRRGEADRYGRTLNSTVIGLADAVAAAAGIVMGEAAEGCPAVHISGLQWTAPACDATALLRPVAQDLFR